MSKNELMEVTFWLQAAGGGAFQSTLKNHTTGGYEVFNGIRKTFPGYLASLLEMGWSIAWTDGEHNAWLQRETLQETVGGSDLNVSLDAAIKVFQEWSAKYLKDNFKLPPPIPFT